MNSAASRHDAMPPIPEMGIFTLESAATAETRWSANGLTAGPQYPPWLDLPATDRRGSNGVRSSHTLAGMGVVGHNASTHPWTAAAARQRLFVTLRLNL